MPSPSPTASATTTAGCDDALDPALGLHDLRDTVRGLFAAAVTGAEPSAAAIAELNRLARPPHLRWEEDGPALAPETTAAEVARTAIELLAGGRLRQCGNPRCILYFLAEGRRQFCSDTCANRTRVARHAARGV